MPAMKVIKVVKKVTASPVVKKRSTKRALVSTSGLILPDEATVIEANFWEYVTCIYGRPGVGKSTWMASYPDVMFFSCERVCRALKVPDFNREGGGVLDWGVFRRGVELLEASPGKYQTIAVDTIAAAYRQCSDWVCRMMGIDHPQDAPYGKGWDAVKQEFESQITRILQSGRGLVMSAHAKESEITSFSGTKYTRIQPDVPGAAYQIIKAKTDFVFYAEYIKDAAGQTRRVLITEGDEIIDAKRAEDLPLFLSMPREGGCDLVSRALSDQSLGIPIQEVRPANTSSKSTTTFLGKQQAKRILKGGAAVKKVS